mgnify:CR=1 FL=1
MHYKIPESRNQMMLFPQLDLWVDKENPVRLIDSIIDKIIENNPDRFSWKGQSNKGCTCYSPATMNKLILYCYFNWISGSRRMEKETYRNIELIWLLGNLHPDHWTICQYRRENKKQIKQIAIEFRGFLKSSGYIEGKKVAVDGSKMKAYASPNMFNEAKIAKRLNKIDEDIEKYLDNIDEIDNLEEQLQEEKESKKELQEKIEKLENNKKKLKRANSLLKTTGKKYLALNDPDASLMLSRDGKKACYNIQTGVDSKYKMIAMAEVTTDENDQDLLEEDYKVMNDQLNIEPEELEADTGYGNTNQIKEIEEQTQTKCYIPLEQPNSKKKDKENNIEFKYDEKNNEYVCPQEKKLKLHSRNKKHRKQTYNIYKCFDCQGCPIRTKCTRSKTGRTIKRNINQQWIEQYKASLETKKARDKIKERKALVEHPFGTIKLMMGKHCFLLTRIPKVQVEVDIYSTAYNLKRLINIEGMDRIIEQINAYKWKIA